MRRVGWAAALFVLLLGRMGGAEPAARGSSADWVEAKVWQVLDSPGGGGVILLRTRVGDDLVVPITVGHAEALSIRIKLVGVLFARPLAHDLIDSLVHNLGARVTKVRIEKIETLGGASSGGTFFGRVFVKQGRRQLDLDARASDSIAIALRANAPIFIARTVLVAVGLPGSQFDEGGDIRGPAASRPKLRPHSDPL